MVDRVPRAISINPHRRGSEVPNCFAVYPTAWDRVAIWLPVPLDLYIRVHGFVRGSPDTGRLD